MALSDKNLVITPNIGAAADPKIVFSGADASTAAQNITLTAYPTNGGTLSFDGSAGQLFSVTNSMSGTIFSANDVSGIPSIEVIDTGLVKIAQYSGNLLLGSGTDTGLAKLQVTGSLSITGNMLYPTNSKSIYGPNTTWSSYLHVGGDGVNGITRTGTIASVVTTNGNLHLDSGSDKAMYFNYYSGTAGFNFGNGTSSAINATISAAGVFNGTNVTVNGNQTLHAGNYTSYSPTLTGGSASGTWGISITGNSATVGGFTPTASGGTANRVVVADANGYIQNNYFYTSGGGSERSASGMGYFAGFNSSDYYIRSYTPAAVAAAISGQTMNIAGNATNVTGTVAIANGGTGTTTAPLARTALGATTVGSNLFTLTDVAAIAFPRINADNTVSTLTAAQFRTAIGAGTGTVTGVTGTAPVVSSGGTAPAISMAAATTSVNGYLTSTDWNTFNNKQPAGTYLTSSNYTSYSPTLTGGSASGLWGINISGSAVTLAHSFGRTDATAYPIMWGTATITTQLYSCTAVTIQSSTGTLSASILTATSDVRVKTNIKKIDNALEKVLQLRGVTYDRTDIEVSRQTGVIAQEVLKVLPEAVTGSEETQYGVTYGNMVGLLIEAIKDQQTIIDSQESRIARLEALVFKLTEGK